MKNYELICRICLKNKPLLLNIESDDISTMLSLALAHLKIPNNRCFPNKICRACLKNLEVTYAFLQKCKETHEKLEQLYADERLIGLPNSEEETDSQEECKTLTKAIKRKRTESDQVGHLIDPLQKEIDKNKDVTSLDQESYSVTNSEAAGEIEICSYPLNVQELASRKVKMKCSQCSLSFFTEKALKLHLGIKHKISTSSNKEYIPI